MFSNANDLQKTFVFPVFVCTLGKCSRKYSTLCVWSNVKQIIRKYPHPKPSESTKNDPHCQLATQTHPATHRNPPRNPPKPTPQPHNPPRNPPRSPPIPTLQPCEAHREATPQPREAQICRKAHRGAHRENRGLMGERESREREQKESRGVFLFWKMVYGKIFRKPFSNFCLMIFRSKSNVFC